MRIAVLFTLSALISGLAGAAGWSIDPIRVDLSPSKKTGAMTIRNDTDQPTSIQIQAVVWTQVGGKDVYTATKELLVSPPIVTIPPKSEQIIRVALRKQPEANKELAYRINLQELPMTATPNSSAVQVSLRIGLPVFVQSQAGDAVPKMTWKVTSAPNGMYKVDLHNSGSAHVQVLDFFLYAPGSEIPLASQTSSSYVLAGQSQEWLLKSTNTAKRYDARLHLKAFTDSVNVDALIVTEQP